MNKDDKNIHDGHRKRLRNLIANAGIESVSDVQAVECFLTYIFPRGDVNPLSHRLLNRYGNFANILDADVNDLKKVKGINESSALKIKLFNEMMLYYTTCKLTEKINLKNDEEFLDLVEQLMRLRSTESLFLFAVDNSFNLIQTRHISLNQVRTVGIDPMELYNFISTTKLAYLAVAHNHPGGTAKPSKDDGDAVVYIETLINSLPCTLIDSLIVGIDGIYSEKQGGFLRHFKSVGNIINFIGEAQKTD